MGWPPGIARHVAGSDQILEMARMGSRQNWLVGWIWDVEREGRIKMMPSLGPRELGGWSCHRMLGKSGAESAGLCWETVYFERIQFVVPRGRDVEELALQVQR